MTFLLENRRSEGTQLRQFADKSANLLSAYPLRE